MHLVLILAVLLAMTLAENTPHEPIEHALLRTVLTFGCVLAIPVIAGWFSAQILSAIRRDTLGWSTYLARFTLGQQLHAVLWLVMIAFVSYVLAWPQVVRENWGLGQWILLDDLLILMPVYVPLLLSWAAYYEVDRLIERLTIPEDSPEERLPSRWRYVLMHARHYLALVMTPLLLVLVIHDTAKYLAPNFAESSYGWLVMAIPLMLMIMALPQLLTALWKTERLEAGPLRARLEHVLSTCRLRVRDILIWKTNQRMINAAVSGVWWRLRYVFLTDGLLARLDDDQVEAVIRHEAGHVARRHIALRMLMLGVPLAAWFSLQRVAPQSIQQLQFSLENMGISAAWQSGLLLPILIACYGIFGLGWYCKQLELEADLFACGFLTNSRDALPAPSTTAFVTALQEIAHSAGSDPHHEGWLHPSIARRVAHLEAASADPWRAQRFERNMTWLAWLIAGCYLASLLALALWR